MSKDKVLMRVKALLAMGRDDSSPKEAVIALDRARKLMDKYQLSKDDVEDFEGESLFDSRLFRTKRSRQQLWVSTLALAVAEMNDCHLSASEVGSGADEQTKLEFAYNFGGYDEDVALCHFMLNYLIDTCLLNYKNDKQRLNLTGNAQRNDYLLSMAQGINRRIKRLISDRNVDICLREDSSERINAKREQVSQRFGETSFGSVAKYRGRSQNAVKAGREASEKVHLGAFLQTSNSAAESLVLP